MAISVFDIEGQKLRRMGKSEGKSLSRSEYNAVFGLVTALGLGLNLTFFAIVPIAILMLLIRNALVTLLGFVAITFGSIHCIYKYDDPKISFIAFMVLSTMFGTLIAIALHLITGQIALKFFAITAFAMIGMACISFVLPKVFEKRAYTLLATTVITLLVEAATMLIADNSLNVFDCISAVAFALYIGFRWQKAQIYPPTLDNAIDSAADIYVDIISLLLRPFSITDRKK